MNTYQIIMQTIICIACLALLYSLYLVMKDRQERKILRQRAENLNTLEIVDGMDRIRLFSDLKTQELSELYDNVRASEMLLANPKDPDNWCELRKTTNKALVYIQ